MHNRSSVSPFARNRKKVRTFPPIEGLRVHVRAAVRHTVVRMVAKTIRTVSTSGPSSRVIPLPPDWLKGSGIDKGTRVEVRYGNLLLLVPPGRERDADRLIAAAGGSL